jgi:hypothetical protein
MARKPWFRNNSGGGWFVPATREGWGILALFIVAVLGTAWLPTTLANPVRVGCGLAYVAISYWFSAARVTPD